MKIKLDDITNQICQSFDIQDFDGEIEFTKAPKPSFDSFQIGLIVGQSGGGKSTLLKEFGTPEDYAWNDTLCVASNFDSYEDASEKLMGVGLNSIPSWLKPYSILSNGEKYRANMAITLKSNAVYDEFTSVLDRNVSKSLSHSLQRYIRSNNIKNVVFASPHKDIIEFLQPDWVYDLDYKTITYKDSLRQRDSITLKFKRDEKELWEIFSQHHYLSADLNKSCHFYTVYWDDVLVGCSAVLPLPSGYFKNAFREHRLVVLPEFQGLGFGTKISNTIAQLYKNKGCLFYTKTAHPKLGEYRERSPLWEASAKNKMTFIDSNASHNTHMSSWKIITNRMPYAHKYVGDIEMDYIEEKIDNMDEWC